jgi:hypothetical protein
VRTRLPSIPCDGAHSARPWGPFSAENSLPTGDAPQCRPSARDRLEALDLRVTGLALGCAKTLLGAPPPGGHARVAAGLPTFASSRVCIYVDNIGRDSFEAAFAKRLRDELDSMHVWLPVASPRARRMRPAAFASLAAVVVGCALVLGTVAAFASGSPNPKVWITEAERTIGIPPTGGEPSRDGASPASPASPEPSESAPPVGGDGEASGATEPASEKAHVESPPPVQPSEPAEHSPTGSPGDG